MALQTKFVSHLNRFYRYVYRKAHGFSKKTRKFAIRVQGIPHRFKGYYIARWSSPGLIPRMFPRHLGILTFCRLPPHFSEAIIAIISKLLNDFFYSIRDINALDSPAPHHKKNVRWRTRGQTVFRLRGTNTFHGLSRQAGQANRADIVLAYTEEPLFSNTYKKAEFLFGEANRPLEACIISLAPLREEFYNRAPDEHLLLERVLKETLHELGHQLFLSMEHCPNLRCVMAYSRDVRDVDRKTLGYCPACWKRIERLYLKYNL